MCDIDLRPALYGSVVGDTSNMTLLNYDTGDTLHTATDVSFSYSGTLFAGIHYQLISDASSVSTPTVRPSSIREKGLGRNSTTPSLRSSFWNSFGLL